VFGNSGINTFFNFLPKREQWEAFGIKTVFRGSGHKSHGAFTKKEGRR
jgi:hypothetical protein